MTVSPEARFITGCVREPSITPPAHLTGLAAGVRDWRRAVALAEEHGVAAFVQQAAVRDRIPLPGDAAALLTDAVRAQTVRTMALSAELTRITRAMREDGCPLLVLKGPALSRTLYPAAVLRPYGDLDLVVQPRDEGRAAAVLVRCGFREVPYAAEVARRGCAPIARGAAFHRLFTAGAGGALVELHVDPLQLGLRPRCDRDRWRRARPVPGQADLLTLDASDNTVYLSVHAHKHGFSRLIWLKDLDLLLRTHGEVLDWDLACTVAAVEGVSTSVWYALRLARRLLGTPVPDAVQRRLAPALPVRLLYSRLWPAERIAALDGQMRRRAVQLHAAEGPRGVMPSILVMGRRRARLDALRAPARRPSTGGARIRQAGRYPAKGA